MSTPDSSDKDIADIFASLSTERLKSMSADELDQLMAASVMATDSNDPHVQKAAAQASNWLDENPAPARESDPADHTQDESVISLDLGSAPSKNADPDDKVDPTSVTDEGVASGVKDRVSSVDHDHLSPDAEQEPDEGDAAVDGIESELDSYDEDSEDDNPFSLAASDGRFQPYRPEVPEPDPEARPAASGTFVPSTEDSPSDNSAPENPYNPPPRSQEQFDGPIDLTEDDEDDESEGAVSRAMEWVKTRPKKYLITAGAAGVVVLLFLAMVVGGGGEESPGPTGADPNQVVDAQGSGDVPAGEASPDDGVVDLSEAIENVSASCGNGSEGSSNAFSSDETVAWVCERAFGIDGAILNIRFRHPVTLHEIKFTPGFNYVRQPSGDDEWNKHRVITRVLWRAGGKQFPQEIVPSRSEASFKFAEPVATESMSMTIQESVGPEDTVGGEGQTMDPGGATGDDPFQIEGTGGSQGSGSKDVKDATAVQNLQILGVVN